MGHHDAYSKEDKQRIVDHVCDQLMGERRSVFRTLAEDEGMCGRATFARWLRDDETLAIQVAHAREVLLEAYIEEMIEIADNDQLDHNSRRVRLLAREKAALMLAPRRFAIQRMDLTSGGKALPASDTPARVDRIEALLALAASRAQARIAAPDVIDIEPEPPIDDVMG